MIQFLAGPLNAWPKYRIYALIKDGEIWCGDSRDSDEARAGCRRLSLRIKNACVVKLASRENSETLVLHYCDGKEQPASWLKTA